MTYNHHELQLADGVVDLGYEVVRRGGETVALTTMEARLLRYLAARPRSIVPPQELLEQVWGYSGTTQSRTLVTTMGRLRAKIEVDRKKPTHLVNVVGRGYRFDPVKAATSSSAPLPAYRDSLFGRDELVGEVVDSLLGNVRLLVLQGPAGVGKTRLSVEVGRGIGRAGSEVTFCDLRAARTPSDLLAAVAGALRIQLGARPRNQLGRVLATGGSRLLILDNFEQLGDDSSAVHSWLEAAPTLKILVTSRHRFGGEAVHQPVEPLSVEAAVALFADRSGAAQVDEGDVEALVDRLDCVPLAIELAAAWGSILPAAQILSRIDRRMDILVPPGRSVHSRSMRAALDSSWELLSEAEREALAQCSSFAGGFTLTAAEHVIDLSHRHAAPWVGEMLRGLCDKSLLVAARAGRYALYESIAGYAQEKLQDPMREAVERRHLTWYRRQAESWSMTQRMTAAPEVRERVTVELGNLSAAHTRALDVGGDDAARIALAVSLFLHNNGPAEIPRAMLDSTLALSTVSPRNRALLLRELARTQRLDGSSQASLLLCEEALEIAESLGDDSLKAQVRVQLGSALSGLRRHEEALEAFHAALAGLTRDGDEYDATIVELGLVTFHSQRGQLDQALGCANRAVDLCRRTPIPALEGVAEGMLGRTYSMLEQWDLAKRHFERALELGRRIGDRHAAAVVQTMLAAMHFSRREIGASIAHLEQVAAVRTDLGHERMHAEAIVRLAASKLEFGDLDDVESLLQISLAAFRKYTDSGLESYAESLLGAFEIERSRYDRAVPRLERAIGIARELGVPGAVGIYSINLGLTRHLQRDLPGAVELLTEAAALYASVGGRRHGVPLAALAAALADAGDIKAAKEIHLQANENLFRSKDPHAEAILALTKAHILLAENNDAETRAHCAALRQMAFRADGVGGSAGEHNASVRTRLKILAQTLAMGSR